MNSRRKSLQGGDGEGCRKQGGGIRREKREEEEGERMLPCLFSDLYHLSCTELAKSGAELPSPHFPPGRRSYLGLKALIHFSFNLLLIDLNHTERNSVCLASGCKIAP